MKRSPTIWEMNNVSPSSKTIKIIDNGGVSNAIFEQVLVVLKHNALFQSKNAIAVGKTPKYSNPIQDKVLIGKWRPKKGAISNKNKNPNKLNKNIPISTSNFLFFMRTENNAHKSDAKKVIITPVFKSIVIKVPFEINIITPINPNNTNNTDFSDVFSL